MTISLRQQSRLLANLFLSILFPCIFSVNTLTAQRTDGNLSMSILSAYNLIVDSNVESPSTYAPRSVHFGVTVCNNGSNTMTDIVINIGDYSASPSTPGVYPERTVSESTYAGTFSFTHVAPTSDAIRTVGTLGPGECSTQYWLVEYPRLDDNGNSVTGGNSIDDDLWLEFDVWASADENGNPLNVNDSQIATMRSEISASANKVYPNGDNKVPQEYLDAIESVLGWRPDSNNEVGDVTTTEGIWFDLGRVNKGFDNDGDFVPDYNVFLQPVGDPDLYDPSCSRLVKTYGLIIVKKTDGTEELIPFEDQIYFSDLPADNNGAVGLVYYDFAIINAPCYVQLSPYQEVASGSNNEKFNGDYGVFTGSITTALPSVEYDADGPTSADHDTNISYDLSTTNTGSTDLGILEYEMPVVIEAEIPEGTNYVSGSAATTGTLPIGSSTITVKYSTDGGITWTETEPADPTTVTNIQWWMDVPLAPGETFNTTFDIQAPASTYNDPIVQMESGVMLGNNEPFLNDTVITILSGINSIGDSVYEDTGDGGGVSADGIQNGTEAGIDGIPVYLYFDNNDDGTLDDGDISMDTVLTSSGGVYSFSDLPDGNFLVVICKSCVSNNSSYEGWGMTNAVSQAVSLDATNTESSAVDINTVDFGFTPALSVNKTITSSSPAYEGQEINYNITVNNLLAANPGGSCDFDTETVRDEFTTQSYNSDYGSSSWATAWQENGESDGPTLGMVYVHASFLRMVISGNSIQRELDLTCANSADLSFTHRTQAGTGQMTLEVSNDNGATWQLLDTYSMSITESTGTDVSYDLMPYRSTTQNTIIRLSHSGGTGIKSFDNFQVEFVGNGIVDSGTNSSDCTQNLWIGFDNSSDFAPTGNLYGAPDDMYASGSWGHLVEGGAFMLSDTSDNITKVEVVAKVYHVGPIVDDYWEFRLIENGNITGNVNNVPLSSFTGFNSQANAGEISVDVTAERASWYWSYFSDTYGTNTGVRLQSKKLGPSDGAIPYIDALAFRITTDGSCGTNNNLTFNPNSGLSTVPLQDVYDPDSLEFISASITPSSIDDVNGIITWDNIGPLNAGASKEIEVIFKAKEPLNNSTGSATNTAIVSNALFGNGDYANMDTSRVSIAIEPTGTISGLIWSDSDADGWQGSIGYEAGTDFLVENATVYLYSCTAVANNGSCSGTETLEQTTTTDATGTYTFEGILPNVHYRVALEESSLPGTVSQTGDPDDDPTNGSGNGGTCGSGGANAGCDAQWNNDDNWFEIGVDTWAGETWDISGINFGYAINPSIAGNIWENIDGDATQDTGELGIGGVTVELQNASCTPGVNCPTTTTDADGNYTFENLSASTSYTVAVITSSLPSTASWTETVESDGSVNNSISITLSSGEISAGHNFGFTPSGTASIGDQLFYDFDEDGLQDSGDEGIVAVDMILYQDINNNGSFDSGIDAYVSTTSTDASGSYSFTNLATANYLVVVDESDPDFPSSVLQSGDPDEANTCITCDGSGATSTVVGATIDTLDFGYKVYGAGSIGNLVWRDINGDGTVLGAAETGIANITVQLWGDYNNDGTYVLLTTDTTDQNGEYLFENLADGNYKVIVDTTDADLPTDGAGNLFSNSTDATVDVTISGGSVINNTDFGFAALGTIGDMIFWDANGNGTQDWTEAGIDGVTVYLCSGTTSPCNSSNAIASTTTSDGSDGNPIGFYQFTELEPGTYTVGTETASGPLSGTSQTTDPNSDGLACNDPDLVSLGYPSCDNLTSLTVSYGSSITGADFGYQPAGVIGDYVWFDANGDGILDSNEFGIGNVQITLTNVTSVTIDGTTYAPGNYTNTIYTDLDGYYTYSNLPDGTYDISAGTPANHTATYDTDGGLDNTTQLTISGGTIDSGSNSWCASSDCSLDLDFGYALNGSYSISGSVCIDDGSEDGTCSTGGETMLEGTVVYLYNSIGESLGQSVVDASGNYSFTNLPAGDYVVSVPTTSNPLDKSSTTTSGATTTNKSVYQSLTISSSDLTGIDFGFAYSVVFDLGDLPASYEVTRLTQNGAYHEVPSTPTLYLGSSVTSEASPIQNTKADGDTSDDGIVFNDPMTWIEGSDGGNLDATVNGTGWLIGWMDFNEDGDFSDAGEMIISQALSTGVHTISFDIPSGTVMGGDLYSRFRLFETEPSFPAFSYTGDGQTGEVEDYFFNASTLPVEITLFSAKSEDCNILLHWESAMEEHFSHYEVQRSTNNRDFSPIGLIPGEGGDYFQQYHYVDKEANKENYYRLKMIDIDGKFSFSEVISADNACGTDSKLMIYPNPIQKGSQELHVRFTSELQSTSFSIIGAKGEILKTVSANAAPGWNAVSIDISNLPSGIYSIRENSKSSRPLQKRFIIQE